MNRRFVNSFEKSEEFIKMRFWKLHKIRLIESKRLLDSNGGCINAGKCPRVA